MSTVTTFRLENKTTEQVRSILNTAMEVGDSVLVQFRWKNDYNTSVKLDHLVQVDPYMIEENDKEDWTSPVYPTNSDIHFGLSETCDMAANQAFKDLPKYLRKEIIDRSNGGYVENSFFAQSVNNNFYMNIFSENDKKALSDYIDVNIKKMEEAKKLLK